jgi:hypothetical protein
LLATLLAGCASETLLQSSFNANAIGAPPATSQAVGTMHVVDGAPGSVVIVGPVPGSNENWVRISRAAQPNNTAPISMLEGDFSQFRGDGTYGFLAALFIPSGSGLASVEFRHHRRTARRPRRPSCTSTSCRTTRCASTTTRT